MSAKHRSVGQGAFSLPPNPSYIEFPRTDGSPSSWPTDTTPVVDRDGHVNFYAYVEPDHGQNKKWRTSVGDAVSLKLKMPEGPNYVLRSFPDGYRLFDHNKGPADNPRHDLYLFGPVTKKRFRSINEFIPHAIWLMGDPELNCECKYCAGKAQREITASMSTILRVATPSLSHSPAPPRAIKPLRDKGKGKGRAHIPRIAEARQRETKNYAAIQKSIKPLRASASVLKQPMLVERNSDIRAMYSKSAQHIRKWYRDGEVVWCALERPITSLNSDGSSVTLEYWPAIIDEVKMRSETIPRVPGTEDVHSSAQPPASNRSTPQPQAGSSTMQIDPVDGVEDDKGPILPPSNEPALWTVKQYACYKVHFLAVSHSMTVDDENILPYQATIPSDDLMNLMKDHPPERLKFDKDIITNFNPCPVGDLPPLFDAIPPYALAIQIASSIAQFWCLTDEYELKYTLPHANNSISAPLPSRHQPSGSSSVASSSHLPLPPPPPGSLQAAIENAGRHNADLMNSTHFYESASAVHPQMSSSSAQQTISRMVGIPPPPNQLSQTRYQGIWWGAERIWVDDFVRLKIPRRSLAPTGDNHILPPAGPSPLESREYHGPEEERHFLGAQMRGTFLRLDGIIVVDVENKGQKKKEARVCGRLYELVALDWEGEAYPTKGPIIRPPIIPRYPQPQSASQAGAGGGPIERTNSGPPVENILPAAPTGYKFREILEPGYEFVGAMGLLSGRYYPGILTHPRMRQRVASSLRGGDIERHSGLWSLEGLTGGYFNSVDPARYKKSRVAMMQDADKEAIVLLEGYAQEVVKERQRQAAQAAAPSDRGDAMEVDGV